MAFLDGRAHIFECAVGHKWESGDRQHHPKYDPYSRRCCHACDALCVKMTCPEGCWGLERSLWKPPHELFKGIARPRRTRPKKMPMRPVVLYRPGDMEEPELKAARKHFTTFHQRTALQRNDFVVGRYSVLPFFKDGIQADCDYIGAELINNFRQHNYLADMRNWVEDLRELTPKTWYRLEDIDEEGPYVLKGKTNSRKFDWKTHMFAQDREEAGKVFWRLATDGLIGGEKQDIYIRKYVPLRKLMDGMNGLPVSAEFRFFTAFRKVICGGFYWSNYVDDLPQVPTISDVPAGFVESVLERIGSQADFVVVDVGLKPDGEPIVVELNDGQMSGLSNNDPEELYAGLRIVVDEKLGR